LFGLGWFVFPLLLVGIALLVEPLAEPALSPAWTLQIKEAHRVTLPWALLAQLVAAMIWIIGDSLHVADKDTPVTVLRANAAGSILVALILTALFTWQLARYHLPWGYIIPFAAAVADAFISADQAINNAAQKPLVQQK
jgi:hypothetical protein